MYGTICLTTAIMLEMQWPTVMPYNKSVSCGSTNIHLYICQIKGDFCISEAVSLLCKMNNKNVK